MADANPTLRARARFTWMADRAFGLEAIPVKLAVRQVQLAPQPTTTKVPPAAAVNRVDARRPETAPQRSSPPRVTENRTAPSAEPQPALLRDDSPFTSDVKIADEKRIALQLLNDAEVKGCVRCVLHKSRTQTVFGEGDVDAKVMFIGEGPGENEDLSGRPFVGRAGEKLSDMIHAMGLKREQVYICNIVKCRPPGNRAPLPDETAACCGFLEKQIETVRPSVIVTLGAPATKYILRDDRLTIGKVRGTWQRYRNIKVMPTFHPAYMLRAYTPQVRGQVWSDLQSVMRELQMPLPKTQRE